VIVDAEAVTLGILHTVREESEFDGFAEHDTLFAELPPLPFHRARLHEFPLSRGAGLHAHASFWQRGRACLGMNPGAIATAGLSMNCELSMRCSVRDVLYG
jgi:hypothetical protein